MNDKSFRSPPARFLTGLLILIIFVIFFITLVVFAGIGYLLSLLLPFTMFQATIIVIVNVFLITFLISALVFHRKLDEIENSLMEDDDDDEEEENDEDEQQRRKIAFLKSMRVGRNEPCPCGSGKKAKYCCMQLQ